MTDLRVVISQPMYLPWAGFFAQVALADVLIWLDDAQFSKGSFTNRVQVKVAESIKWLSIPLMASGSFKAIRDLSASKAGWANAHRALLSQALKDRPHRAYALSLFDELPSNGPLVDFLIASAEAPALAMGLRPNRIFRSSALKVPGNATERVLSLVQAVNGTEYITGHGALAYLNHQLFEENSIKVSYMDYAPLPWPQGPGSFTPYVTILDLLASVGPLQAQNHLNPQTMEWRYFARVHREIS
ncbi:MAG: hypothetical protein B7Y80_20505 [Hyphomicrobium sp. 32-62-53]|nr:MAG: hypothetical protein B7Z29_20390 [Hyphomicrobium sp. 12-62-95]OYX97210.1 MAG: hypothetical protein B7Y80_20505 [Hyphomicrobium sp. 32-62-53]